MTHDEAGVGRAEPPGAQNPELAPDPHAEDKGEHNSTPGGPLATPDTIEGREAAEAEGEEA